MMKWADLLSRLETRSCNFAPRANHLLRKVFRSKMVQLRLIFLNKGSFSSHYGVTKPSAVLEVRFIGSIDLAIDTNE
jgi:hypothetical protein